MAHLIFLTMFQAAVLVLHFQQHAATQPQQSRILTLFNLCSVDNVTMKAQSLSNEQRRRSHYLPFLIQQVPHLMPV